LSAVHAYLKTALFHFDGASPTGVVALSGDMLDQGNGGITLKVSTWFDSRGREVKGKKKTLVIPWGKLDHVEIVGK